MDREAGHGKKIFERSMAIIEGGSDSAALKAIDVVRDHWPELLPPFTPRAHRDFTLNVMAGGDHEQSERGG